MENRYLGGGRRRRPVKRRRSRPETANHDTLRSTRRALYAPPEGFVQRLMFACFSFISYSCAFKRGWNTKKRKKIKTSLVTKCSSTELLCFRTPPPPSPKKVILFRLWLLSSNRRLRYFVVSCCSLMEARRTVILEPCNLYKVMTMISLSLILWITKRS